MMVSSEHLNGSQSRLQTHNGFDKVCSTEINFTEKILILLTFSQSETIQAAKSIIPPLHTGLRYLYFVPQFVYFSIEILYDIFLYKLVNLDSLYNLLKRQK